MYLIFKIRALFKLHFRKSFMYNSFTREICKLREGQFDEKFQER